MGVEVEGCDGDAEGHVHARGGGGACGGFGGDAPEGGGSEGVRRANEVVCEPHVFGFFGVEGDATGAVPIYCLFDEPHAGHLCEKRGFGNEQKVGVGKRRRGGGRCVLPLYALNW